MFPSVRRMDLVRGKLRRLSDSVRSRPGRLSKLRSASPTPDRRVPYGYAGAAHRWDSDAVGMDSDSPVEYIVVSQTPKQPRHQPHEIDEPEPHSDNMLAPSPKTKSHGCDVWPSRQPGPRHTPPEMQSSSPDRNPSIYPPGQTTIYQRGSPTRLTATGAPSSPRGPLPLSHEHPLSREHPPIHEHPHPREGHPRVPPPRTFRTPRSVPRPETPPSHRAGRIPHPAPRRRDRGDTSDTSDEDGHGGCHGYHHGSRGQRSRRDPPGRGMYTTRRQPLALDKFDGVSREWEDYRECEAQMSGPPYFLAPFRPECIRSVPIRLLAVPSFGVHQPAPCCCAFSIRQTEHRLTLIGLHSTFCRFVPLRYLKIDVV